MFDIIITSILVIGVMLFFLLIMFKNIIKRINKNAKKFFINKLDDYDDIVKEKEQQIEVLNEEIKKLLKNKDELEKYRTISIPHTKRNKPTKGAIYSLKVPKYREENFFTNYKELKNTFDFNKEELIKNFIKEHQNKKDEKDYKILCNFKNKFDKEAIYQLMTLSGEEQIDLLEKILTEKEKELIPLDAVTDDKHKFTIMKLFEMVDKKMIETDPYITIYVSKYDIDYNYIDPYIKTVHYPRMSEGLMIEYKGKSYDYSI